MKIRKAQYSDLDRMVEIYAKARVFMAEHGNPRQWGPTNWPPVELIEKDIEAGKSYVCVNDDEEVTAVFFFDQGQDIEPTYKKISEGKWLEDGDYGVVHRIASDHSQKGIGSFCINWAYERCGHLRIDTHGDNTIMQELLSKLGFIHCGTIYVEEDDYPRLAFEKSKVTEFISELEFGTMFIFSEKKEYYLDRFIIKAPEEDFQVYDKYRVKVGTFQDEVFCKVDELSDFRFAFFPYRANRLKFFDWSAYYKPVYFYNAGEEDLEIDTPWGIFLLPPKLICLCDKDDKTYQIDEPLVPDIDRYGVNDVYAKGNKKVAYGEPNNDPQIIDISEKDKDR
ncbi:MAG: hypothetical protein IJI46_08380 [Erysipelotrichaceae bacterium]|nr:hypothetical protein [Erysipelotrichaceae bacterium]